MTESDFQTLTHISLEEPLACRCCGQEGDFATPGDAHQARWDAWPYFDLAPHLPTLPADAVRLGHVPARPWRCDVTEPTETVVLSPEDMRIVAYRGLDAEELGVPHQVPAWLVDAYELAQAELDAARDAILVAAGYDPDTAWHQLANGQEGEA